MSLSILSIFIPTFFLVSITPGMCMMLAFTMGMSLGLRRTMWMMFGELLGVGLVASLSAIGVAAIMLNYPNLFVFLKYGGGAFLCYQGVQLWLSRGKLAFKLEGNSFQGVSRAALAFQGFITAIANPKGWAFFIALLPPFINYEQHIPTQLLILILLILMLEFMCLLIYAGGASRLRALLVNSGNVKFINRIAGSLMLTVGVWLALS
ncbi:MAG: threonine/homoserine/homoserine lactone efflux protein [Oleiphilaceae bacterium]|jgi:threonine/homoserine/homoserine lactone efflux protein